MFRKPLIYGALELGIKAGGTRAKDDLGNLDITLAVPADRVDGFIAAIQPRPKPNSLGAEILSLRNDVESRRTSLTRAVLNGVKFCL
jgi:hypothetical protein